MEILAPSFLRAALDISLALTAMSALVLAAIVMVRLRGQVQAKKADAFRRAVEPLVTAYLAKREDHENVVDALQRDPTNAMPLLMEIADRLDPQERLALHPLFVSLPQLTKETTALQSHHWEHRLQAAERLGYLGDDLCAPALLDALQDPVLAVRYAAARSLAILQENSAIRRIVLAFDLPSEMNQRRVAEVLYSFGTTAVGPLLEILKNEDDSFSDNSIGVASRVLGMLREPSAAESLIKLLDHPEFRVRLNAVRSLGAIGDRAATDPISRLACDPSWEVRNVVMQALGKLHSERHIGLLTEGLRDASWWVRYSAAQALWEIGKPGHEALTAAMYISADRFACDISRQILQENGAIKAREELT